MIESLNKKQWKTSLTEKLKQKLSKTNNNNKKYLDLFISKETTEKQFSTQKKQFLQKMKKKISLDDSPLKIINTFYFTMEEK